jgi:hypothetical protein
MILPVSVSQVVTGVSYFTWKILFYYYYFFFTSKEQLTDLSFLSLSLSLILFTFCSTDGYLHSFCCPDIWEEGALRIKERFVKSEQKQTKIVAAWKKGNYRKSFFTVGTEKPETAVYSLSWKALRVGEDFAYLELF